MKRDMDLIRRIALAAEELPMDETLDGLDGVEQDVFSLHVIWMKEAGLVHAAINEYMDESAVAFVFRLTWSGCEFADAVRSDTLWKKAKDNVMKPSMSFTFDVLKDWLKTEITQGLPTIRALSQ
ncbi:DUF2513 domain-containing protein [Comamonas sp. AG1104]|uniref:DUF2513 domain-containing protein n=1 Tax=Comamonas sp. AG1104 TaxID=2183900 RepID=UPI000E0B5D7C|nr:DUF2513 domain-containing protein [Comamonas sp. AG1104]RDI11005.1 uncharacterized protein DUF2513 [Comamonas sp. AG1104]